MNAEQSASRDAFTVCVVDGICREVSWPACLADVIFVALNVRADVAGAAVDGVSVADVDLALASSVVDEALGACRVVAAHRLSTGTGTSTDG